MKKVIEISEKDLAYIAEKEFDQILDVAKHNSYCSNCSGKRDVEMVDYKIFLDSSNDVMFTGSCKHCSEMLVRLIELKDIYTMKTNVVKKRILKK